MYPPGSSLRILHEHRLRNVARGYHAGHGTPALRFRYGCIPTKGAGTKAGTEPRHYGA
jgi:hypothetical protein